MQNVVTLNEIEPTVTPAIEGHHGNRIWYIFNKDTIGTEGLRLHVQEFSPGGYTEDHAPHENMEQAYYILTGSMAVTVSGKDYTAGPGSFVFIPRGAEHKHRNLGQDKLTFLTINVAIRDGQVPPLPPRR